MKLILCDRNANLCSHWRQWFGGVPDVSIVQGDFFAQYADAAVSPANSFGFMDGGIDQAFLDHWGYDLQDRIQDWIKENGEILVGQAITVPVLKKEWCAVARVISAPTMRTPRRIVDADAVRLSTRAALREATRIGATSILMTGMGAGAGAVPAHICAEQMRKGWGDVFEPKPFPKSWREAAAM